jgi:hypothetical protein
MEAWNFLAGLGLFLNGKTLEKKQIQIQNNEYERFI